jgi:hypothetical protein
MDSRFRGNDKMGLIYPSNIYPPNQTPPGAIGWNFLVSTPSDFHLGISAILIPLPAAATR